MHTLIGPALFAVIVGAAAVYLAWSDRPRDRGLNVEPPSEEDPS